jgi:hypothetical protein
MLATMIRSRMGPFLSDLVGRFLDEAAHCLADFATWAHVKFLHGLLEPLDLYLGLLDVKLDAFA